MIKQATAAVLSLVCMATGACSSGSATAGGPGSFQTLGGGIPTPTQVSQPTEYHLGPYDKIGVSVYQMPSLTFPELQIDGSGMLSLPEVGVIDVAGKTTGELQQDITTRLAQCCLRNPQVIVTLREALSQQITVMGAVRTPNVYSLRGRTTLTQALALANGADSQTANLHSVAILRNVNGQRMGAKFDLDAITRGQAADPEILAGDTIIVDTSGAKSTFRTAIQAVPFFGVFAAF